MNQPAIIINTPAQVNLQMVQFELARAGILARYQAKIAELRLEARCNHRIELVMHGEPDYWIRQTRIRSLLRQYDRDILALYLLYRDVLRDVAIC